MLKDVPGALSKVATLVASMGLNLVESNSFSIADSATAEWGFFAEADDGNVKPEAVETEIKKLPDVIDCRVKGAEGRIVVDNFHYPITLTAGAPAMLIRREVFTDTLKFMIKTYGSAGASLIYQLGKAAGQSDAEGLVKEMGIERVLENLPELVYLYVAQGWGVPELVNLEFGPITATLRIHDNFECKGRDSLVPTSHFIRGHLSGMAQVFFDRTIDCTELKCVSKGDPYCEFVAKEIFLGKN